MKKPIVLFAAALVMSSCGGSHQKADDPIGDSGRTVRTENLLANLLALGDSSIWLFGQQDATVCGIGWEADYANDSTIHERSDVKSICNDHPALLSFELSGIERGDERNIDSIPFSRIRQEVIAHYDQGGIVSLSWSTANDAVTDEAARQVSTFLNSLETPYGVRVPVLLRTTSRDCPAKMKEHGVVNALYVYAMPLTAENNEKDYMASYPGDDIIDIIGLDCYCMAPDADTTQIADFAALLDKGLTIVCRLARQHHKVAAVTATGYEGIKTRDWWTRTLAPVLEHHPISYVVIGRNAHTQPGQFYAPYPGQQSSSDFIRFYNDKHTLFLHDVNGIYLPTQ